MRLPNAPATVVALLALLPMATAKPYPASQITTQVEVREVMTAEDIEKRQCTLCGYEGILCCETGTTCGENELQQAVCIPDAQQATAGPGPAPTGASCADSQVQCASTCCDTGYWCQNPVEGICAVLKAGTSPGLSPTPPATPPLRPTASTLVIITATGSTVSFETPIPTGVNGTPLPAEDGGSGLGGGAIAGIVIGVILGIILLLLLCLYCCAKTVFDGFAALLGFGKKRRHTHEETYIEEHHHHSHHGSAAGAAAMGGRRWYGQGPARPSRPPPKKKNSGFGGAMGIGAGLAGLAIALGLKRKHDRRRYEDDKTTTVSGSSGYTYSDYTSTSSASSDDRYTRPTRHSSRR